MHYCEQLRCKGIISVALDFADVYAKLQKYGEHGPKWRTADAYLDGIRALELMLLWAAGHTGQSRMDIDWMEDMRKSYIHRRNMLLGKPFREIDDFLPEHKVEECTAGAGDDCVYYSARERRDNHVQE